MPRYAIYFTPKPSSTLAQAGSTWLGRNPYDKADTGSDTAARKLRVDADWLRKMTASPRRYGFHATLKAPMHLMPGLSAEDFVAKVQAWAAKRRSAEVYLQCATLGRFVALRPADHPSSEALKDLASACVVEFDDCRAPLSQADLERRLATGLSPRQVEQLHQWGYPYVFDEFRFHMTLSRSVADKAELERLAVLAKHWFARPLTHSVTIDCITVFEEPDAGRDFIVRATAPFADA